MTIESSIVSLVDALVASKGWMRAYADAVVREAVDRQFEGWASVTDRFPASGRIVLARYLDDEGKGCIIRAKWVAANTEDSSTDSNIGIYDDVSDKYYDPEGWYECIDNWDDYTYVFVYQGTVSHWMPMPVFSEAET